MITVYSAPPKVTLAGDPIIWDLTSNNFLEIVGVKAQGELEFYDGADIDDTVTLEWSDKSLTFTCKASPDDSGLQFKPIGTNPLSWFINELFNAFNTNFELTEDYDIYISGDSILFDAKEFGDKFNITFSVSSGWNADVDEWNNVVGIDQKYRDNFRINIQIFDDTDNIIGELSETPDNDGRVKFYIKDYLFSIVESSFTYPDDENLINEHSNICRKYYIKYWESYGIPSLNYIVSKSDDFYTLLGSSSFMQQAYYNENNISFWDLLQTQKKFLTLQPGNKKVSINQTEKLFFLHHVASTQIALRLKIQYTDDSTYEEDIEPTNVEKYKVYEFSVGYGALDIYSKNHSKEVEYWEVSVFDIVEDQVISEVRKYYLDNTYYKQKRYFIFQNSWGGFDTLRAVGIGESKANYEREDIKKILPDKFTSKNHEIENNSQSETRIYTVNIGILNNISGNSEAKDWENYLRQLELSKKRFEIISGKIVPIRATNNDVPLHRDDIKIYDYVFSYTRAFYDESFSDDEIPITGDYNNDYSKDYFVGNQ